MIVSGEIKSQKITKAPDFGAFTLLLFITIVILGCPARARTWTFLNQNQACCQLHYRTILKRSAKLTKGFNYETPGIMQSNQYNCLN
jgi:hypothetical protein